MAARGRRDQVFSQVIPSHSAAALAATDNTRHTNLVLPTLVVTAGDNKNHARQGFASPVIVRN